MKCYRVYDNEGCVGTFFSLSQAIQFQVLYTAEGVETKIEIEEYEY